MKNKKVHKDLKADAIQLTIQAHKSYKEHSPACSTYIINPPIVILLAQKKKKKKKKIIIKGIELFNLFQSTTFS